MSIKLLFISKPKTISLCLIILILFISYCFCLPKPLFKDPSSTVIYSSNKELLGAMIANDGQWRFPETHEIPSKFEKCILYFEDKNFYYHPGFNPYSLSRALVVNAKKHKKILGGSTLTMQLIRISRKGKSRTYLEKLIELILSTRAEIRYSKKEILSLYASHAPFGSNVVGIDAASWRYYGRAPENLSWAETATLAVLPNSPSLIFPGKNHDKLMQKRNRLLQKLYKNRIIDKTTFKLSLLEPIPSEPAPVPQLATHLLTRVYNSSDRNKQIVTTIDYGLQTKLKDIIEKHVSKLKYNEINNAAALIADVESGNVLAYVGNSEQTQNDANGNSVDIITSPRSTGSILKPILYAAMLDDGAILPGTLIPDIPVMMAGYSPKNYSKTFDGAVHAQRALSRSLNIPAVFMLKDYSYDRFYALLKKCGMTTLNYSASHYGLSLILGGAEGKLWDVAGIYASMARTLNHFSQNSGLYNAGDFHSLNYIKERMNDLPSSNQKVYKPKPVLSEKGYLNAASLWLTFKALLEVNRPEEETGWEYFLSSKQVAWKTGTSFGFRDGWAIGTTPRYVVAVWVGNADGEGRPGLTGVDCAAPILFDIFQYLPNTSWFQQPYDEMQKIPVCTLSGCRATDLCSPVDSMWVQVSGLRSGPCPYHKLIHLDKTGKYRVTSDCASPANMKHESWFILPPVQEWYYKWKNPLYKPLPPMKPECSNSADFKQMEFIYPKEGAKVFVPIDIDNKKSKVIIEVAHRKPETTIYWHLDGNYIGSTQNIHQMGLAPQKGFHHLDLVDEDGNIITRNFYVE